MWKHEVPICWPERFSFDNDTGIVVVHGPEGRGYRFTYNGRFLDAPALEGDRLEGELRSGYGYPLFDRAVTKLEELESRDASSDEYGEVANLLRRAVGMSMSDNVVARAFRLLGEMAERAGELEEAITRYESALAKHPGIGVKVRLKRLKGERAQVANDGSKSSISPQSDHEQEVVESAVRGGKRRSAEPYQVVDGSQALDLIEIWPTKHAPGPMALNANGEILWAPQSARNEYVACQKATTLKWMAAVRGRPRQIAAVGDYVYVLTGKHGQDEGMLAVLDPRGRELAVHALPGFASRLVVNPQSTQGLVVSADRDIRRAEAVLIDGPNVVTRIECSPSYHWMDVVSVCGGRWIVGCRQHLLVIATDGRVEAKVTPPPHIRRRVDRVPTVSVSLGADGRIELEKGAFGFATKLRDAYAMLGLTPPVGDEAIKNAFRQKLREWHPDINRNPSATEMTRRIIDAHNVAIKAWEAGSKAPGWGEESVQTFETDDTIRSLVSDEDSGEALIGCHSGRVYRLDGTELVLHWDTDSARELLYSGSGGSTMLVRDEATLRIWPSGTVVAEDASVRSAFDLRVRGCSSSGRYLIYSGDDRNLFVSTSAFARCDHLKAERPIRDVVVGGAHVYLATGQIEVASVRSRPETILEASRSDLPTASSTS